MKKNFIILFAVFLLLLSACTNNNPDTTTNDPEKEMSILDEKEVLDETGILSYIQNEYIEDGIQQEIYNFQENLLISSFYYDDAADTSKIELELVSTQTGELLCKNSISGGDIPTIQVLERNIVVSDGLAGKVVVLDSALKTEQEYELKGNAVYLNKIMTKAFCIEPEGGIKVVNLSDGTSEQWLESAEGLYISKACGDYVALVFMDGRTGLSSYALLNLAAEDVHVLSLNKSFYGVEHNSRVWLAGLVGETDTYLFGTEETPQVIRLQSDAMPGLVSNSDDLIVSYYGEDGSLQLTAYRSDGTFLSKLQMADGAAGFWGNIIRFESLHGYLFTSIDDTGTDKLYYWDTSVETSGENLILSSLENGVPAGDSVSDELYEKAERIGKKYGISVKIAEQCEMDYGSYTVEQNMNEDRISRGLDILDQSLASYPDGFIKQLYFGYYRELEINLMGSIYATEQVEENKNGFDSFIAFVQQQEEKYVMIFDLSRGQLIEQDLYHEFSHLIDKKLQNMADQGKKVVYSEEKWDSLNPDGFEYANSYADVPASYYYDGYDDYFVDVYSRTFPTEDRARIMEYSMIGAEFCFDTYPGLMTKLKYYCESIRDGFDTTGWPEVTKWEEMLFLVD